MNAFNIHRRGWLALLLGLPLLLAGMMLASPTGMALAQDEPPFGANVVTATTTANLHIRTAPSRDAESLAILPVGTVVGFTGLTDESGDWVQVDAAGGPVGWVSAAFLSDVPDGLTVWNASGTTGDDDTTGDEEVVVVEPPFGDDVVTATTTFNLHIRSAPSRDAESLAILPAGTVVGFTGLTDESGDWVQVDAAGGPVGWVSAAFLSDVPDGLTVWSAGGTTGGDDTTGDEEVVVVEPPFGDDVVTATTTFNLHIRSAPSRDAESLAILPAGTVVGFTGLTDESGEWVQVDAAGGPVGWVSAAYLSNVPDDLTVWTGEEGG